MALDAFHGGTATTLSVLVSESAPFSRGNTLVQARPGRVPALVSLFNAIGGSWGGVAETSSAYALTASEGRRGRVARGSIPPVPPAMGNERTHAVARDKGEGEEDEQCDLVECHWRSPRMERAQGAR